MAREPMTRRRRPKNDDDTSKYLAKDRDDDADDTDEDDDEDDKPRRGSRRGSSTKSSGRGRSSRRSRDDDDDEDEKPRRRRNRAKDDDEEEEERPKRKSASGWDGYEENKVSSGNFPDRLEIETGDEVLIKFLDDGPFAVYKMHWLNWRDGKKSWNCLDKDGCPICDMTGDKPRQQALFNVVEFPEDDDPRLVVWTTSQTTAGTIRDLSKSKSGPIDRDDVYFSVTRSGKGKKTKYTLQPIKERDLEEDWEVQPLTEEELDAFYEEAYDDEIVYWNTKRELREIAEEMLDR